MGSHAPGQGQEELGKSAKIRPQACCTSVHVGLYSYEDLLELFQLPTLELGETTSAKTIGLIFLNYCPQIVLLPKYPRVPRWLSKVEILPSTLVQAATDPLQCLPTLILLSHFATVHKLL